MKTKINIPSILKRLGIQKNSKSWQDYEIMKRWLHYQPIDQADYDKCIEQVVRYLNV